MKDNFEIKKLKDVSDIISGFAFKINKLKKGNDRIIRIGDLQGGKIIIDGALCFDNNEYNASNNYMIKNKDILMALSGATVGKIAVATPKDEGLYLNQRIAIIRAKENQCAEYLKYIFYGKYLETLLLSAGGAAQPNLSPKSLENLEIPVPQLATQHHIATTLDHATALIEKRKTQISELDNLIKAVFLEMFGDPTVNSKDWEIEKLVNVCNPKQWRTISTSELLPSGYTVYGANGIIGYFNEYTHQNPTLMITCRGATCGNVHISKPFSYINGNAMALDDLNNSKINILFLFYLLKIRNFYDVISGSAQPQITKQGLDVVLIPLPPLDLQTLFAEKVCKIQAEKDRLQRSLVEMEQYLQSLMAKFFE